MKSVNDFLKSFSTVNADILQSVKGANKVSIYKKEIFESLNHSQKVSLRKKIRNNLQAIASSVNSFASAKDNAKLQKAIKAFNEFYREFYAVNDYTLASLCNNNLQQTEKDNLQKMLDVIAKNKKSNK